MAPRKRSRARDKSSAPGRLRIVAGKWRSRLLPVADVPDLRPTSERIRETLFNWLTPSIEGASCLDLFAGSGALGLEALSRGAASVTFVENSPPAAGTLRRAIETLQADGASVHEGDALELLRGQATRRFDVVFVDPPFATGVHERVCRLLDQNGWLADNGMVYLEQDGDQALPALPAGWTTRRQKIAGNVRYSLIEAGGEPT